MRVLIACEFSGVVRDAFRARGHDAWSCDLLATEREGPHIFGNILDVLDWGWGLMIAHPPCTALCRAGDRWYRHSPERQVALEFVQALYAAPVPRIAIENPRGLNRFWRAADQVIQPWMFGHGETKATCLWLKNLPPLLATSVRTQRKPRAHFAAPGPQRWRERSRTLEGIAEAMAMQWG
ncbi:MAG TPA: DNA cytosine methyltransferase [Methylomirabilota bacterium]|nr:DNA cytosine methyltransferase [Methylomirabilota bacterium]